MPTGNGWTSQLLTGLAELLAVNSVGTWRTSGAYTADETAITIRAIPQSPDRIICLAAYPLGTSMQGMADHDTAVQFRLRGTTDPRVCDDLADAIFDLLDSAAPIVLGTIVVPQLWRQSYTSLGQDGNDRWERSENYYLQAMRPTANNTD